MYHKKQPLGAIPPQVIAGIVQGAGSVLNKIGQPEEIKFMYPQCGKRPFFPGQRRKDYEACVMREVQKDRSAAIKSAGSRPTEENFLQKYKTPMLVGAGVLTLIILKRKNLI